MEIYHGSTVIVEKPEIRIEKFNKDFYFGFLLYGYGTTSNPWGNTIWRMYCQCL